MVTCTKNHPLSVAVMGYLHWIGYPIKVSNGGKKFYRCVSNSGTLFKFIIYLHRYKIPYSFVNCVNSIFIEFKKHL